MTELSKPHRTFFVQVIFAVLIFGGITSCSKSDEKRGLDNSLLQYVPADTPYVFANPEPLPDDVLDKLEPAIDSMLRAYATVIRTVVDVELEKVGEDGGTGEEDADRMDAVATELESLMTLDGLRSAGVGRGSTMVLYGEGLLPVFRLHLTDSALMEQTISRIEEKADMKMATGTIGKQSYRFVGDEEGTLILALVDNDMVATIVPASHTDELLKSVLGLSKPSKSIADSGELQQLMEANEFEPYSLLSIDVKRIVATFLDEQSGSNAELLAMMQYDASGLSDVCKTEIREMAGIVPRIIAGYTEFNTKRVSSNFIVELRQDIADGLATLVAPVQGLGLTKGGLFSFGISLDMLAAREFYSARLDAMEADPFECENFAELQAGVAQGRELLKQPIPPIAYSVKGFLAVVDALEGMNIRAQQPPTSVDASFLLSIDNPQGLLAMGTLFSPELAALNLQPDGKPRKLELPPVSPAVSEAFIAMTDNALAISLGQGGADRIVELFDKEFADPAPFMSMFMDAGQYYGFVADTMLLAQPDDPETPLEITAAMSNLMRAMEGWFGETSVNVHFTERGVEMPTTVEFAETN
jgi:hypothetical protein